MHIFRVRTVDAIAAAMEANHRHLIEPPLHVEGHRHLVGGFDADRRAKLLLLLFCEDSLLHAEQHTDAPKPLAALVREQRQPRT